MQRANIPSNQALLGAIKRADELSKVIVDQYPQVAGDYRAGLSHIDIVDLYGIDQLGPVGVTRKVARQAVLLALKTLIPDEKEREELGKQNMIQTGIKNGEASLKNKKGVHALSAEEHGANALKANEALGNTAWSPEEQDACISKLNDPQYKYPVGKKLCPDLEKIAAELNRDFHNSEEVRTKNSIRGLRDSRKKSA